MSNHVNEWLNAYLDGELKGGRLQQVEEHLSECEACQAELDSLMGLSTLLHEVPLPDFPSPERFATQVNLLLPQKRTAPPRRSLSDVGWWMIPVGILAVWVFISTAFIVSSMVSVADSFGLLDKTTASFISDASESAGWTSTLGQVGVLKDNSLQWAESTESFTKDIFPLFVWQASIGLMYLAWMAVWWVRHTRQSAGQLVEG